MIQEIITRAIENEVRERGISVRRMAGELGLPQRTLANVLSGVRGMGGRTMERIMQARPDWWALLNNNAGHPSRERS